MATTPNHGIYYPTETDQITPIEQVFATQASSVESALTDVQTPLQTQIDDLDAIVLRTAAGELTLPAGQIQPAAGESHTINLPAGKFTLVPTIVAVSDVSPLICSITDATTTTATVRVYNPHTTAIGKGKVNWIAMQNGG